MHKIKDERLQLQNLKNIRIAFGIQTIGILIILAMVLIRDGLQQMIAQPLWIVFMLTSITLGITNLGISVDSENNRSSRRPISYSIKIMLALGFGLAVGILNLVMTGSHNLYASIIVGLVVTVCLLVPYTIVHYLRKRKAADEEE